MAHPGGRPLKFETPEELQKRIDEYFEYCDSRTREFVTKDGVLVEVRDPRPYTVTGLAMFLKMSREGLLNYAERDQYFDAIRDAKLKIQNFAEESLWTPKIASGVIFNLTNNWGWKNQQSLEQSGPDGGPIEQKHTIVLSPELQSLISDVADSE